MKRGPIRGGAWEPNGKSDALDNLLGTADPRGVDDAEIAGAILSGERAVIVYDLEGTCWKGVWSRRKETIEIGAVRYRFGEDTWPEFQTYVKPVAVPRISRFCTELTGITQAVADAAPEFPRALYAFLSWAAEAGTFVRAGWGNYEQWQLDLDLELHGLAPISGPYLDLKKLYGTFLQSKASIDEAVRRLGITPGAKHRAIDDARVAAQILDRLMKMVASPRTAQ